MSFCEGNRMDRFMLIVSLEMSKSVKDFGGQKKHDREG